MKITCLLKPLMGIMFAFLSVSVIAQNPKPFVVPELKSWEGSKGEFVPSENLRFVCDSKNQELKRVVQLFAEDYKTMFGKDAVVTSGRASKGDFEFIVNKKSRMDEEAYSIQIGSKVRITASSVLGVHWGIQTLLQLSEQHEMRHLPQGVIRDYPDYKIRGFMMDCGRKYIPMAYLSDLVRIMSYYKMNTLQVHLNDNGFKEFFNNDWNQTYSAFRLECDTYPGLTASDGSYSKKEFIDFQYKSADRFVEIIPEIDAPAHTLAFTQYKPEIGSKEYGMDHLDLFNPETYLFMDQLFKEYLEGDHPVFVGSKVHIGTDEYSNKDKKVVEKFREFTDHYIKLVEGYGKQACLWGALTHAKGETKVKSENVIMGAWYNGYADPKEMVKQGYKLISIPDGLLYIVPGAGYYYDYLNTQHLYEKWTPAQVGSVVFDDHDPAILGGMFAVWNDHVGNGISVKDIHHRVFPALQTLSAKMWTGKQVTLPFAEFDKKRNLLSEAPGVNQLSRIGNGPALVYETEELKPGMELPYTEIGYDYTVSFDIEASEEVPGTELLRSDNAVVYLSDPIGGKLGFSREGYLNSFRFKFHQGEKSHVEISGNNKKATLKINGRIVADLTVQKRSFEQKNLFYTSTLCFPLKQAGAFKSKITQFKVYNYLR